MSAPLIQFVDGAEGVQVDLATLIATRAVVQGSSGAGKSHFLRYMLEQTHGQIQQFVIDPEGEFATLRERFDYVVASAGEGGDVPADPHTAKLLARQLVELGVSAILDLYELDPDDRSLFVARFLRELISLPKDMWRPLLVVVDEAHEYAPQTSGDGPPSLGPMRLLSSKGRKRGFGAVFATQRISKLHKDVADAGNFLIGYTGLDVDILRAGDMLGMDKTARQALKRLDPGMFYAFGPAISRDVQLVRSGAVQTTHPKAGELGPPTPPAPAAIQALLAQLHDIPERAAEEEAELERLKRENADLKRQARSAPAPQVDEAAIARRIAGEAAEAVKRITDRLYRRDVDVRIALGNARDSLAAAFRMIETEPDPGLDTVSPPLASAVRKLVADVEAEGGAIVVSEGTQPNVEPTVDASLSLKPRHLKILEAIARLERLGLTQPDRSIVAGLADTSPTSSGYDKSLGELKGVGLIRYPSGGHLELTAAGRALTPKETKPPTLAEVHAGWFRILAPQHQRILEALIAQHPAAMTREALASASNNTATSSGYDKALGRLKSLRLIDYPERGSVVATSLLMPKGLKR